MITTPPIRVAYTAAEAYALYNALTDERPAAKRVSHPLPIPDSVVTKLHVALQEFHPNKNKL